MLRSGRLILGNCRYLGPLIRNNISRKMSDTSSYAHHIFETDADKEKALEDLKKGGWTLVGPREAISKSFTFKNFVQAYAFMTMVAMESEKMDHHPEWKNVYNKVDIQLTSHFCNQVSRLDVSLAHKIDKCFADHTTN